MAGNIDSDSMEDYGVQSKGILLDIKPESEKICALLNERRRPKTIDILILDGIYHIVTVKLVRVGEKCWKDNACYWMK